MDKNSTEEQMLILNLKSRGLNDADIETLKEVAIVGMASSTLYFFRQVISAMQIENISDEITRLNLALNLEAN